MFCVKFTATFTFTYCDGWAGQATATDDNGDAFDFSGSGNPGWVTVNTDGSITAAPTCLDLGTFTITVVATETSGSCALSGQCTFQLTVENAPPTVTCPPNAVVTAAGTYVGDYSCTDDCPGQFCVVSNITGGNGVHGASPQVVGSQVIWNTHADDEGVYTIELTCEDECGETATCQFEVEVVSYGFSSVMIADWCSGPGAPPWVNPGEYVTLRSG